MERTFEIDTLVHAIARSEQNRKSMNGWLNERMIGAVPASTVCTSTQCKMGQLARREKYRAQTQIFPLLFAYQAHHHMTTSHHLRPHIKKSLHHPILPKFPLSSCPHRHWFRRLVRKLTNLPLHHHLPITTPPDSPPCLQPPGTPRRLDPSQPPTRALRDE